MSERRGEAGDTSRLLAIVAAMFDIQEKQKRRRCRGGGGGGVEGRKGGGRMRDVGRRVDDGDGCVTIKSCRRTISFDSKETPYIIAVEATIQSISDADYCNRYRPE